MKILVLNYEFPPIGGGGGKVSEDICRILATRGHNVRVQTSYFNGLPKYAKKDGYKIYRSFAFRRKAATCTVLEMGLFIITSFFPTLWQTIIWKPDLIHVHFAVPTGVIGFFINLFTSVPYVLTVHLGDVPGGIPDQTGRIFKFVKPLTVPIWEKAAGVTAVSGFIKRLALQSYNVSIKIINNGIDLSKCNFSPLHPLKIKRVVFAGRFSIQKNLPFLIDVMKGLKEINWKLDMLGDGPLMNEVKIKIKEEGLFDRIKLHGWVDPSQVSIIMSQSDVLFLPSLSEGLPVVGVLALAHGIAIVGSDIGGLRDVVQKGENGYLIRVNDRKGFVDALRSVLSDNAVLSSMKKKSRELSLKFDLRNIVAEYENIFKGATR